jgi:hypothetical protein
VARIQLDACSYKNIKSKQETSNTKQGTRQEFSVVLGGVKNAGFLDQCNLTKSYQVAILHANGHEDIISASKKVKFNKGDRYRIKK